jgi:biotin carboxylase
MSISKHHGMLKEVIFIGAARLKLVKAFVKLGWGVALFASNTNNSVLFKTKQTEVKKLLDFVIPLDLRNTKTIERSLKGFYINPKTHLFSDNEKYLLARADIADALNIKTNPFLDHTNGVRLTSKFQQRSKFAETFPEITVPFRRIVTFHGAYLFTRKYGFPVIVKPVHLSQSQLVEVCYNLEELIKKASYIFSHIDETYKSNGINRKPAVIIEKYITGRQYSVDSYVNSDGEMIHTPICKQTVARDIGGEGFETVYSGYPSYLSEKEEKKVYDAVEKSINGLGVKGNPTHIEVKLTDEGEAKVIEVNLRNGGMRADLLMPAYGINHEENTILNMLDAPIVVNTQLKKYAVAPQFWAPHHGWFLSVEGVSKVRKLKSFVKDRIFKKHIHQEVGPAEKGYPRLYYAILAHEDEKQLQEDLKTCRELVTIKLSKTEVDE